MHRQHNTPLRVSVVAVFVALLMAFLFGGTTRADEESLQSAATQSANVATEAQSSDTITTAATSDNEDQSSSGVATGSNCTPRPISAEEIQTDLKTQDGSMEYTAYEAVQFSISLTLEEGHCGGDYHAEAWWKVHMEPSLIPGETRELRWTVDGVIRRQSIQVGTCDGCSQPGPNPSKWGSVDGGKQSITVVLPTATQSDQEFVVTDKLTSPGQHFTCDNLIAGRVGVYTSANDWGAPQYVRFQEPDITSCDNSKAVINVRLNKGEKARVQLNVLVDSTDPGPWMDTASIVSQDQSWETSARVVRRESGGNAGFDTNPTPTPTPTPEPTPTPAPSPSPSAPAPTPSTSPTPSPSAPNPSATPNPTPSPSTSTPVTPTPAPSASPTPSTSPTPSVTPTPVPSTTPAPSQTPVPHRHRLPVTGGTTVSVATSAIALLAIGGVAIWWARRRQAARSK